MTPEPVEPTPAPRQPVPINRVVVLGTAILSLLVAVLPVIADLDWTSTAGLLAGLAVVAGVVLKWLDGWQQYEGALYQADLTRGQVEGKLALLDAEADVAERVGGASKGPRLNVPRR